MSGQQPRLFTPLAVVFVLIAVGGLVAWTVGADSGMFSPGPLNAEARGQSLGGVEAHAALSDDCGACHPGLRSGDTMAELCLECHQDVRNEMDTQTGLHGRLLSSDTSESCRGCHTEHGGATARLTVVDASFPHDVTGFSLLAHQGSPEGMEIGCAACHGDDLGQFDPATCAACHESIDADFMQGHVASFGQECVPCHDGIDRYPEDFDHNELPFQLTGAHVDLECGLCHEDATSVEALQNTPQDCFACHEDDDAHAGQFGQECGRCHTPSSWDDATFDHARTDFPLTGAHVQVSCAECHAGERFSGTATDCLSCHAEPEYHAGAFGARSTECAACHTSAAWIPAALDLTHDIFPMDHGEEEQQATCRTCHPDRVNAYTCYGCHEHTPDNVLAEHEGRSLAELEDCVECHEGGREGEGD